MRWQPPTPVGGWPVVEPQAEAPRDIEVLRQCLADEREDAAILRRRRSMAVPTAPASVSVSEMLRLMSERPEAVDGIKAVIAGSGVADAQKMLEIRAEQ